MKFKKNRKTDAIEGLPQNQEDAPQEPAPVLEAATPPVVEAPAPAPAPQAKSPTEAPAPVDAAPPKTRYAEFIPEREPAPKQDGAFLFNQTSQQPHLRGPAAAEEWRPPQQQPQPPVFNPGPPPPWTELQNRARANMHPPMHHQHHHHHHHAPQMHHPHQGMHHHHQGMHPPQNTHHGTSQGMHQAMQQGTQQGMHPPPQGSRQRVPQRRPEEDFDMMCGAEGLDMDEYEIDPAAYEAMGGAELNDEEEAWMMQQLAEQGMDC